MNLYEKCTTKEKRALEQLGIDVEDREYTDTEIRNCVVEINEHIMSKSSKNGDLSRAMDQYNSILSKLVK